MATIPLKDITFPGLDNTYTIPEIDNTLSTAGKAADAKKTGDEISQLKSDLTTKADLDELYKAFPTDTASGAVASFSDGANVPVKSLTVNIDPVQSGSGDPSPTNVRPISGWSEVNVQRTGKNLFDEANATIYKRYFQAVKGEYIWSSISDSSSYAFKCLPNTTYTLKPNNPNVNIFRVATINVSIEESENATLNQVSTTEIPRTITTDADATYIVIQANNSIASVKAAQLQIELGESATTYESYSGTSITIALGQTVYGGKLDVTKGELTVDSAMADLGTLDWEYISSTAVFKCSPPNLAEVVTPPYENRQMGAICSAYSPSNNISISASMDDKSWLRSDTQFFIRDTAYNSGATFKTAMSGVQLVYELASPLTIQLTPHEVTALLGSNNIWADTGDSAVEYRVDPTLYIQRLTEPDADMIADANIVSGQYFMVGNTLYKATANIASGATISPNVNCTRKSLSEALNELNV